MVYNKTTARNNDVWVQSFDIATAKYRRNEVERDREVWLRHGKVRVLAGTALYRPGNRGYSEIFFSLDVPVTSRYWVAPGP